MGQLCELHSINQQPVSVCTRGEGPEGSKNFAHILCGGPLQGFFVSPIYRLGEFFLKYSSGWWAESAVAILPRHGVEAHEQNLSLLIYKTDTGTLCTYLILILPKFFALLAKPPCFRSMRQRTSSRPFRASAKDPVYHEQKR